MRSSLTNKNLYYIWTKPPIIHQATPAKHVLVYADDDEDDLQLVKEAFSSYADIIDVYLFDNGYEVYNFYWTWRKTEKSLALLFLI